MLPIKPVLENHTDDRAIENYTSLGDACTSTSPKTKELRARYEAEHPIAGNLKPHKTLRTK